MIEGVHTGVRLLVLWGILQLAGCAQLGDPQEEVISLSTRLDRNHAIKFNAAGVTHYEAGHPQMALVSFENSLCHDPNYGPALNNMGRVHFDQNDLFQAAMAFEKAIQLMPGNPSPINNLGLVFESAGRITEAIELYQTAHDITPACAEYLGNLVRARLRLGIRDESVNEQLRQLLFIDTRPEWIEWAEELLALDLNPMLDRGLAGPDFSDFDSDWDDRDRTLDELVPAPVESIPIPNESPRLPEVDQTPIPPTPRPEEATPPGPFDQSNSYIVPFIPGPSVPRPLAPGPQLRPLEPAPTSPADTLPSPALPPSSRPLPSKSPPSSDGASKAPELFPAEPSGAGATEVRGWRTTPASEEASPVEFQAPFVKP